MSPNPTSNLLWTAGDAPDPVSPEKPLVGLETLVLGTWLDNSPRLRKQYEASPANRLSLENAVRGKVEATFAEERRGNRCQSR